MQSVLSQTLCDLACIVVDDKSDDGTPEALAAIGDPRLRVLVSDERLGGPAARNLGVASAAGAKWVAFLDSDDLWAPEKLEAQLAWLELHTEALWSATACAKTSPDLKVHDILRLQAAWPYSNDGRWTGCVIPPPRLRELLKRDNIVPAGNSTVLVSRDLFVHEGGYDTHLSTCDDYDLWLRLARLSPLCYLDSPLAAYRIWEGQSSNDPSAFIRDFAAVRARQFPEEDPLPPYYRAQWAMEAGRRSLAARQRLRSVRNYVQAARLGRAPGQLAYALAAAIRPASVDRLLRNVDLSRIPEGWVEQVGSWLAAYRQDDSTKLGAVSS